MEYLPIAAWGVGGTSCFLVALWRLWVTLKIIVLGTKATGRIKSYYIPPDWRSFVPALRFYETVKYEKGGENRSAQILAHNFFRPRNAKRKIWVYKNTARSINDLCTTMSITLGLLILITLPIWIFFKISFIPLLLLVFAFAVIFFYSTVFLQLFYGIRKFGIKKHIKRSIKIWRLYRRREKQHRKCIFTVKDFAAYREKELSVYEARAVSDGTHFDFIWWVPIVWLFFF